MALVPSVFQVDSWVGIMGKPWSTDDTLEIMYFPIGSQMYNTCTFCYCLNIKGILYYTWPLINTRARILTEFCPSPQLEAWVRIGVIWQEEWSPLPFGCFSAGPSLGALVSGSPPAPAFSKWAEFSVPGDACWVLISYESGLKLPSGFSRFVTIAQSCVN